MNMLRIQQKNSNIDVITEQENGQKEEQAYEVELVDVPDWYIVGQVAVNRTLILEQLLTTGGGWQDQYGGVLHGVKLLQTPSGMGVHALGDVGGLLVHRDEHGAALVVEGEFRIHVTDALDSLAGDLLVVNYGPV